mgnify:CR=1 FL=1
MAHSWVVRSAATRCGGSRLGLTVRRQIDISATDIRNRLPREVVPFSILVHRRPWRRSSGQGRLYQEPTRQPLSDELAKNLRRACSSNAEGGGNRGARSPRFPPSRSFVICSAASRAAAQKAIAGEIEAQLKKDHAVRPGRGVIALPLAPVNGSCSDYTARSCTSSTLRSAPLQSGRISGATRPRPARRGTPAQPPASSREDATSCPASLPPWLRLHRRFRRPACVSGFTDAFASGLASSAGAGVIPRAMASPRFQRSLTSISSRKNESALC